MAQRRFEFKNGDIKSGVTKPFLNKLDIVKAAT